MEGEGSKEIPVDSVNPIPERRGSRLMSLILKLPNSGFRNRLILWQLMREAKREVREGMKPLDQRFEEESSRAETPNERLAAEAKNRQATLDSLEHTLRNPSASPEDNRRYSAWLKRDARENLERFVATGDDRYRARAQMSLRSAAVAKRISGEPRKQTET